MAEITSQIERFRAYLRLLAESQTAEGLREKVDLSGVVQQSLWEAGRTMAASPIDDLANVPRLLRRILSNNLRDEIRRATAAKRDVRLEKSIETSSVRLGGLLRGAGPTPSENAIQNERAIMVAEAIVQLSDDQRTVIVRHYLAGESVQQTALAMSRSVPSVAGLLHRALGQLRSVLTESGLGEN